MPEQPKYTTAFDARLCGAVGEFLPPRDILALRAVSRAATAAVDGVCISRLWARVVALEGAADDAASTIAADGVAPLRAFVLGWQRVLAALLDATNATRSTRTDVVTPLPFTPSVLHVRLRTLYAAELLGVFRLWLPLACSVRAALAAPRKSDDDDRVEVSERTPGRVWLLRLARFALRAWAHEAALAARQSTPEAVLDAWEFLDSNAPLDGHDSGNAAAPDVRGGADAELADLVASDWSDDDTRHLPSGCGARLAPPLVPLYEAHRGLLEFPVRSVLSAAASNPPPAATVYDRHPDEDFTGRAHAIYAASAQPEYFSAGELRMVRRCSNATAGLGGPQCTAARPVGRYLNQLRRCWPEFQSSCLTAADDLGVGGLDEVAFLRDGVVGFDAGRLGSQALDAVPCLRTAFLLFCERDKHSSAYAHPPSRPRR